MGRVDKWFATQGHKCERLGCIQASLFPRWVTLVNLISLSLIFFIYKMKIVPFFFI